LLHAVVLLLAVNRVSLFLTIVLVPCIIIFYSNRQLALAAVVALCVAATGYIVLDPGFQYMESFLGTASNYANRGQVAEDLLALSGRQEMWETIWESCQQSIWLGHGYSVCSPTGELFIWYEWSNWTAHNVVLQCLMSTGLVGLTLLMWALARIGYQWMRNYYRGRLSRELTVFLIVMCLWNVVWGAFNSSFLGPVSPESVTFYVLIGLAVGAISACGSSTIPSRASENNSAAQGLWA
jgi:O-antigen ligase